MNIVVLHTGYGCETGCCGHVVEIDNERGEFEFEHPAEGESDEDFARRIVIEKYGEDHCADIDFENCIISPSGHY